MEKLYGYKAYYLWNYTVSVGPTFGGIQNKPLRLRQTIFLFIFLCVQFICNLCN